MRHLLVLAIAAALLAAGYFLLVPRTSMVEGRVVLRGLDGEETPGVLAEINVYTAVTVDKALRQWSGAIEASRAANRLEVQAARSRWTQSTSRRDEAMRILRVAEQANAADLEICRARHREAAADAEDALRHLEQLEAGLDQTIDPARFVADLSPALRETVAASDGSFRIEVPSGEEVFIAGHWSGNHADGETIVWLRRGRLDDGENVQFSNANLLTAEKLAEMARAQKRPESPKDSPAD